VEPACGGPLQPVCEAVGDVTGGVVGTVGAGAIDAAMSALGRSFVSAAESVVAAVFSSLDSTTRVDLGASWFEQNVRIMATVTLPLLVGLLVLQVIGSVLRREPGGLARAVLGVGKATLGSVLAIALTQLALRVCDEICAFIAASAGTTVAEAGLRFFQLSWLAGPQVGFVLQSLLATAVLIGCLLLWLVLLFRKAALLLVAVFAPVAFAGYGWDHTRVWARRWIEAVVALVFCKVVIVVVFVLGASAFTSTGTTDTGEAELGVALSDLLVGLLVLSIAVLSPWLTFRFVHWAGAEAGTGVTDLVAGSPVPAAVRSTGGQLRWMGTSMATTAALGAISGGAGAAAGGAAASAGSRHQPPPPGAMPPPPAATPAPVPSPSNGGGRRG
jgi:hypothetical protein